MILNNQKIAIVVVTYNRYELLKKCIKSLRNQTIKIDEIIVVNNSSTDDTLEWLTSQNDLTVITQENSGSAGGQYTGIKTAYEKGYDWIFLFEDELIADPTALEYLEKYANTGLSAVACIRINQCTNEYIFSEIIKFNEKAIRDSKRYPKIDESHLNSSFVKVFSASFEGLLLNKLAVQKIGLPKKEFFIWYDDVEYCMRLNEFGPIYSIPNAKVFRMSNNNEKASANNLYKKMLYGLRNYAYLESRAKIEFKVFKFINYISIMFKYLNINKFYFSMYKEINISILKHFILCSSAIFDGLRGKFNNY